MATPPINTSPLIEPLQIENPHYASRIYKILHEEIEAFESELDDDHEVAIRLVSFGTSILMNVESIGYHNTDLLFFYGYVGGNYTQLIQHVSQLNLLLTSAEKEDKSQPPRRIGFTVPPEAEA